LVSVNKVPDARVILPFMLRLPLVITKAAPAKFKVRFPLIITEGDVPVKLTVKDEND